MVAARLAVILSVPLLGQAPFLAAQAPSVCATPGVTSREQLVNLLHVQHGSVDGAGYYSARLAAHGQPVVGWALEIATDSGGSAPDVRAAALLVLRYARWKPAMSELMRLAQPLRGPWVVWRSALSALTTYPYQELTPYWLDLMRFPRRVVREDALRGLSTTGDSRVLPMVREATKHEEDAAMHALVAEVETRLRMPLASRDTATFGWPPDSMGGRFVPSRSFVERSCR